MKTGAAGPGLGLFEKLNEVLRDCKSSWDLEPALSSLLGIYAPGTCISTCVCAHTHSWTFPFRQRKSSLVLILEAPEDETWQEEAHLFFFEKLLKSLLSWQMIPFVRGVFLTPLHEVLMEEPLGVKHWMDTEAHSEWSLLPWQRWRWWGWWRFNRGWAEPLNRNVWYLGNCDWGNGFLFLFILKKQIRCILLAFQLRVKRLQI